MRIVVTYVYVRVIKDAVEVTQLLELKRHLEEQRRRLVHDEQGNLEAYFQLERIEICILDSSTVKIWHKLCTVRYI